ncbi:MAG TPA: phosphoribosylanthranilate isomerase [Acidimicrobiia bacterium]|nr:phosphoribosylanthranilate isomerase [Acidimicrobiia bacterium]
MTDRKTAQVCVEAGVKALGFVFADSPRRLSAAQAESISASLPPGVLRVAVFRRPSQEEVANALEGFTPDLVQADHEAVLSLRGVSTLPVYREHDHSAPGGGRFLFEGPVSGVGRGVDLARAEEMARLGEMVLAGGLRPDNVGRAITRVRPFGVDVSSGVESSPGEKSPELIRAFVAAVRAAEERQVRV